MVFSLVSLQITTIGCNNCKVQPLPRQIRNPTKKTPLWTYFSSNAAARYQEERVKINKVQNLQLHTQVNVANPNEKWTNTKTDYSRMT